jgi:hypothetical protein
MTRRVLRHPASLSAVHGNLCRGTRSDPLVRCRVLLISCPISADFRFVIWKVDTKVNQITERNPRKPIPCSALNRQQKFQTGLKDTAIAETLNLCKVPIFFVPPVRVSPKDST